MPKLKTVCAIVVNDSDQILLIKRARKPFKGYWAISSGVGESRKGIPSEIGVVEEVNCDLGTKSFQGRYLFSLPIKDDPITDEAVVFGGKIDETEINLKKKYTIEYKWVDKDSVEEFENLAFEHTQIIKRFFEVESDYRD